MCGLYVHIHEFIIFVNYTVTPPPLAILMISEFHSEENEYKAKRESCFCNTAFVNL